MILYSYHGKVLRDFSHWVNDGEILCDFCHDLNIGGFYVTCKVIPVFKFVSFKWKVYVRSKFLRKIFPCNNYLPTKSSDRGGDLCVTSVKSPQIDVHAIYGLKNTAT